jgi:hypothetical protein
MHKESWSIDNKELIAELKRVHANIRMAAKKAAAQIKLLDKLTAAQMRVERLMKQLRRGK